jgi:hypothetical protein
VVLIISWFETDDIFQRISILFLMACLFGYTTNITAAFDITYPTLIGFYLAARLYMAVYLGIIAFLLPMIRNVMLWHVGVAVIATALWVGSIYVAWPYQLILIFITLYFELMGQNAYFTLIVIVGMIGGRAKTWLDQAFQFVPAINIEHRTERM